MKISGSTRLLGFFGSPSSHSLSPAIYNHSFLKDDLDFRYLAFNINQNQIKSAVDAMRTLNMVGANVSMPCKEIVADYLDEISLEAKLIGAVNTIVLRGENLIGENTDAYGLVSAVKNLGVSIEKSRFLVLGCGGAAKSAIVGLYLAGAKSIDVAVRKRSIKKAEEYIFTMMQEVSEMAYLEDFSTSAITTSDTKISVINLEEELILAKSVEKVDVLINATNVGMGNQKGSSIVEKWMLHPQLFIMDMIYEPRITKLMELGEKAGIPNEHITNGLSMLIGQAERAYYLFTGEKMDVESVREALSENGFI